MKPLVTLFTVFFRIGLFSIGGGYAIIPLIQEQVVHHYHWLSQQSFADIITISQMTPGPLAVNTSTFVGMQIYGIPGAIIATFGCTVSGVSISIMLYRFLERHSQSTYVLQILSGLKSASLGLIMSATATILLLTLGNIDSLSDLSHIDWTAAFIFILSLVILHRKKISPVTLMMIAGLIGGIFYAVF